MDDERIESVRGDLADIPERDTADRRGESGWVTTKVAAATLRVNPRTIRSYIERGELEAKLEGEGVQKTYSVSVDSVYALRDRRGPPRRNRTGNRKESAGAATGGIPAGEITGMLRDITAELVERSASEAELRTRLELTAQAESTLREELARERERADRLEAELREARKPPAELREALVGDSEGTANTVVSLETQEPVQRRSWLKRFFGFE